MASLKAEKPIGTQLFGQAKKEVPAAKTTEPKKTAAPKASASKPAPKKAAPKPLEPKKKGGKGGKPATAKP
ncbi:hypothetical protein LguiA_032516 [Lonicera macranthoides]